MNDTPIPATMAAPSPAAAKWNEITIPLLHPITFGDRTYSAITLREPDLEALEMLEDAKITPGSVSIKQTGLMVKALSGVPDEVLKRLHTHDVSTLVEAMVPLLGGETA